MSILQELEQIRKQIGIKEFNNIELFLSLHPQYFLSDVYYKSEVYDIYELWKKNNNLL